MVVQTFNSFLVYIFAKAGPGRAGQGRAEQAESGRAGSLPDRLHCITSVTSGIQRRFGMFRVGMLMTQALIYL